MLTNLSLVRPFKKAVLLVLACAALPFPKPLAAQHLFGTSQIELRDSVGAIRTVRELHDGTVLLPNDHGGFLVADFGKNTLKPVGVNTGGRPSQVYALGADSTLVQFRGGWILLDGLVVLGQLPPDNPVVTLISTVAGTDTSGLVLTQLGGRPADSAKLVLVRRATGDVRDVAKVFLAPLQGVPFGDVREQGVLARDGWVAVLRVNPYRIDWRRPDGTWVKGQEIEPPIPMSDSEKIAVMARDAREMREPAKPPSTYTRWPDAVPAISGGLLLTPTWNGYVLVQRMPNATRTGTPYDVVDRTGERTLQFDLGPYDRVVGAGRLALYIRRADRAGGAGHLVRYAW